MYMIVNALFDQLGGKRSTKHSGSMGGNGASDNTNSEFIIYKLSAS